MALALTDDRKYDDNLVNFLKDLNPRMYVPEEYESGSYISNGRAQKMYEDEENRKIKTMMNEDQTKLKHMIPITYQESIIYGDELASVFEEHDRYIHEKRRMFVDGAEVLEDSHDRYISDFVNNGDDQNGGFGRVMARIKGAIQISSGVMITVGLITGVTVSGLYLYKKYCK